MVVSDTPGIINQYKLQERAMEFVKNAFEDADCTLYGRAGRTRVKNEAFEKRLTFAEVPVIVLINKIDQGAEDQLAESVAH
jgi:GTP-binding protein Era